MQTDDLTPIIESIGALADTAEADRWKLAEAIYDAFQELPLYSRGLTSGLCLRLKRSTDSIYALRDSFGLKSRLRYESEIPVSHFSTLAHLQGRYDMSDDDCREWLDWVQETNASVREMSIEISTRHTADQKKEFLRAVNRAVRLLTTLYQDSESVSLPQPYRIILKAAMDGLREVLSWGD